MNSYDLSVMHEDIYRMIEDLFLDDKNDEGNQMLAHSLVQSLQMIEAELALRESKVNI